MNGLDPGLIVSPDHNVTCLLRAHFPQVQSNNKGFFKRIMRGKRCFLKNGEDLRKERRRKKEFGAEFFNYVRYFQARNMTTKVTKMPPSKM